MNNKEAEIEEFRKRKILCTEDTLRRMKSEYELQKGAKRRERLYDLFVGGSVHVIRQGKGSSGFGWVK